MKARRGNPTSTVEKSPERKRRDKRRRARADSALEARCRALAGPVTVTYLPRVGGEQPVRASSDESQQPRDDPATPDGPG
jgi:hypothetical protein